MTFASSAVVQLLRTGTFQDAKQTISESPVGALQQVCEQSGKNLLFIAAERKSDDEALFFVRELVEGKAQLSPSHRDNLRQTPLFFAARDGNVETLTYLAQADADVTDDAGQSALFYACREGRTEVVERLLSRFPVDINRKDYLGQTALFYAAREAKLETIQLMLDMGCNVNARDLQKKTCLHYAQSGKSAAHKDAADMIRKAQASAAKRGGKGSSEVPPPKRQKISRHKHQVVLEVLKDIGLDSDGLVVLDGSREIAKHFAIFPTPAQMADFERQFPNLTLWKTEEEPLTAEETLEDCLLPYRHLWGKTATKLLDVLEKKDDGFIFARPVDPLKWNCPDYYSVVKSPMDFETIKKKIKSHKYVRLRDFEADVEQVFTNCFTYNGPTSPVFEVGKKVQSNWQALRVESQLPELAEVEDRLEKLARELLDPPACDK